MSTWQSYLKEIYYNPSNPSSFTSRNMDNMTLLNTTLESGYKVKSRTVFNIPINVFQTEQNIVVARIDDQWSMDDLADMTKYAW